MLLEKVKIRAIEKYRAKDLQQKYWKKKGPQHKEIKSSTWQVHQGKQRQQNAHQFQLLGIIRSLSIFRNEMPSIEHENDERCKKSCAEIWFVFIASNWLHFATFAIFLSSITFGRCIYWQPNWAAQSNVYDSISMFPFLLRILKCRPLLVCAFHFDGFIHWTWGWEASAESSGAIIIWSSVTFWCYDW